jgi:hypothetical protein
MRDVNGGRWWNRNRLLVFGGEESKGIFQQFYRLVDEDAIGR